MKILVTGCAGLIGSHLLDNLIEEGFSVIGIDNLSYGLRNNISKAIESPNFKFIENDVKNISNILKEENFDFIYHLASMKKPWGGVMKSSLVIDENYLMTKAIVEYSIVNKCFLIFTSTSDVYGNSKEFKESEKITIGPPTNERYSYAMSKLISEQYIFNEISQSNLQASVVRIFGCASERSKALWSAGHVPLFIYNALNNKDLNIHGDGLQTRSISSAKDISTGLSEMINYKNKIIGEIFNLGTDEQTTVKEVAEYIVKKTNSKSKIIFTPKEKVFGDYDEILIRYANTSKVRKIFDFKINLKTFEIIDSITSHFSDPNSKYFKL